MTAAAACLDAPVLSIVMCAYNEQATITRAIHAVLDTSYPCPIELIVVDDGSTDRTAALASVIADPRLTIHRHPANLGKGAALITGVALARGSHIVPFDADLEYDPADIPKLLAPVLAGRAPVVYGTRLFGCNTVYQTYRYAVGNRLLTRTANLLFNSSLSDLHTCLKLIPRNIWAAFPFTEHGFGLDTEITALLLRHGIRPFEVPVSYYSRTHAQGKKITWHDALRCVHILIRVRLAPRIRRFPGTTRRMTVARFPASPILTDAVVPAASSPREDAAAAAAS